MANGIDDAQIRMTAHKNNVTITAVCRKLLVRNKPELAAAWPAPTHTPKQLMGHQRRVFDKDVNVVEPIVMQGCKIILALMKDPDNGTARTNARRHLETYAKIKRPVHTDVNELPPASAFSMDGEAVDVAPLVNQPAPTDDEIPDGVDSDDWEAAQRR